MVFIVPCLAIPFLMAFHHGLLAVIVAVAAVAMGLWMWRKNICWFYEVRDAHKKVHIVRFPHDCEPEDCGILFYLIGSWQDNVFDFIYNWAYNTNILEGDILNLYVLDNSDAKAFFRFPVQDVTVLGYRFDEMAVTDATYPEIQKLDRLLLQLNTATVNGENFPDQNFCSDPNSLPKENVYFLKGKFSRYRKGVLLFAHAGRMETMWE